MPHQDSLAALSVLGAATVVAVAVVAADSVAAPPDRFPIDLNDLRAEVEQRFNAADADGDGQLSKQEFEALPAVARRVQQLRAFERLDANADGGLSLVEFASRLTRLQALDANADGFVSRDEMPRNKRARRGEREQREQR